MCRCGWGRGATAGRLPTSAETALAAKTWRSRRGRDSVRFVYDDKVDDEQFLAAWAAADENALDVLLDALPQLADTPAPLPQLQTAVARIRAGVVGNTWPYDYFSDAARWSPAPPCDDLQCLPCDDLQCFMDALISTKLPEDDPEEWEAEDLAAVQAVEHSDWVGSVVGLVRAGPGAPATTEDLLRYIDECPELEGERDPDDDIVIEHAFEVLLPLWEAIGVVDDQRRV